MKYNYKYAKLDGDKLIYAPNKLVINNQQIFNAPREKYISSGWLPIVKTAEPESGEGYYYSPIYVQANGFILQKWEKNFIEEVNVDGYDNISDG